MNYLYHSTEAYHRKAIRTLGWELTLCNALEPHDSPCRKLLKNPAPYGELLYDYLAQYFPSQKPQRIVEIGGGYGFLMRGFLNRQDFAKIVMIDISPLLIEKQRNMLRNDGIEYRCEDFLKTPIDTLSGMDIAIMNENLGDFSTLTDLDGLRLDQLPEDLDACEREVNRYRVTYGIRVSENSPFALNIGALTALEKLCVAGIPLIYLAEHSCEATVPFELKKFISVRASGHPERIPLCGHDEYTIRFSDLETMAKSFGYIVRRGPLANILEWDLNEPLRRTLSSPIVIADRDEITRQFIGDLYQYEYLVMSRKTTP
jgi:hypothetical protein